MTVIVVTGIQTAGKSTVAQALAETFPRGVHVRGEVLLAAVTHRPLAGHDRDDG